MMQWHSNPILYTAGVLAGVIGLILAVGWSIATRSESTASQPAASGANKPARAGEVRGVWSSYQVTPDWDTAMQKLSQANFNAVFPYVCSPGVAYYTSKVLPVSRFAQDHDYLAEAVAAGGKWGIGVHARVLALELLFATDATKAEMAEAGRLMLNTSGTTLPWLCPTDERNRRLLKQVVTELVTNYGIEGLQFDYLRYPWRDCCFCARCREQFAADTGAPIDNWPEDVADEGALAQQFNVWRQQQLTGLLGELVAAARTARPDIIISAAVLPHWQVHAENFGQCAQAWVERGLLDFVCPMNYTADRLDFATWLLGQRKAVADRVPLIVGIGPFSDACQFSGPEQLVEQIQIGRAFGAGGFIVFNYNEQFAEQYLPYLAEETTAQPARPVWGGLSPESPSLSRTNAPD